MYMLPHIVRVIKAKEIRFAGHVSRTTQVGNASETLIAKVTGKEPFWITWLRR